MLVLPFVAGLHATAINILPLKCIINVVSTSLLSNYVTNKMTGRSILFENIFCYVLAWATLYRVNLIHCWSLALNKIGAAANNEKYLNIRWYF